ncbi:MAG TPA: secretin N-terminal domain-containing protein [Burkholderiales bacterium]
MMSAMCKLPARIFTVLFFCLSFPLHAEQLELEVITLKYRTAQDVLPIVQPFVNQAGGTVTGTQNRLIVRTTHANLAEVRQILAGIDTLPRRLMVTVKQDAGLSAIQRSAELSGNAAVGKAQVIVPPTGRAGRGLVVERQQGGNSVRTQVQSSESRVNENNVQQLQVLEGSEAFISAGQSVPVPQQTIIQTPQGTQVVQNTEYRDVATGFYVKPRVFGEQVTLEVSPQRERIGPDGRVDTQRVATTVSGRLGEWMELGGIDQSRAQQNSGIASRDSEHNTDQRRIYIKVEEIR